MTTHDYWYTLCICYALHWFDALHSTYVRARADKENSLHGLVHLLNKTVASEKGSDAAVSRSLVLLGPIPLLSLLCVCERERERGERERER